MSAAEEASSNNYLRSVREKEIERRKKGKGNLSSRARHFPPCLSVQWRGRTMAVLKQYPIYSGRYLQLARYAKPIVTRGSSLRRSPVDFHSITRFFPLRGTGGEQNYMPAEYRARTTIALVTFDARLVTRCSTQYPFYRGRTSFLGIESIFPIRSCVVTRHRATCKVRRVCVRRVCDAAGCRDR